jgi:putative spermidine/putrescine transport system ATP-binding protein
MEREQALVEPIRSGAPEAAPAGVRLEGVTKRFGDFVAVDHLDLELAGGEFFTLLGPSGCGKTTTLRMIAGFEEPSDGRVLIDDDDVVDLPPYKRPTNTVFQSYALFPHLSVGENVGFGLRRKKVPKDEIERRVRAELERVGLATEFNRRPSQLSGGMQQRVALARALAIEPRLLLLDEPLSALDAKVRVQLREEIRRIQTRLGITSIYVTHDQEEALSISDRVAVLSHGRIEQIGTPSEIYGAPATPFVAEFVGTMNRIESTVADPDDGRVTHDETSLAVDAVRGRPRGERVLVLVRPEIVEVEAAGSAPNGLVGEVVSQTFLGSVTRLRVLAGPTEWTADLSAARAAALPIGARVSLRFPSAGAKVLSLEGATPPEPSDG